MSHLLPICLTWLWVRFQSSRFTVAMPGWASWIQSSRESLTINFSRLIQFAVNLLQLTKLNLSSTVSPTEKVHPTLNKCTAFSANKLWRMLSIFTSTNIRGKIPSWMISYHAFKRLMTNNMTEERSLEMILNWVHGLTPGSKLVVWIFLKVLLNTETTLRSSHSRSSKLSIQPSATIDWENRS